MESVGIRELRQNLSVYVRRVASGEALRVTDHGHPVAVLAPLPRDDDPLAELIAAGKVVPAGMGTDDLPAPLALPRRSPRLSEVVREMRDEDDR
jgi:prevent-host-death family protein